MTLKEKRKKDIETNHDYLVPLQSKNECTLEDTIKKDIQVYTRDDIIHALAYGYHDGKAGMNHDTTLRNYKKDILNKI